MLTNFPVLGRTPAVVHKHIALKTVQNIEGNYD